MRIVLLATLFTFSLFCTAYATTRSVTFHADGAYVEIEADAVKGVIEIPLPPELVENSLRIKPLGNTALKQVDIITAKGEGGKREKELEKLQEQKYRLLDRLKALETREQIFTSAAKSQSAKAPRKTKTNPDPMQSIRKGTDFAITQLEDVYASRRRTEQELKRVDQLLDNAKRRIKSHGNMARIVIGTLRGAVSVRYILKDVGWFPRYDARMTSADTTAMIEMSVLLPGGFGGYKRYASLSKTVEGVKSRMAVSQADAVLLAQYRMPVTEQSFGNDDMSGFSFVLKNSEKQHLPAGELTVYRDGEYRGKIRFEGLSSGGSRKIGNLVL